MGRTNKIATKKKSYQLDIEEPTSVQRDIFITVESYSIHYMNKSNVLRANHFKP